jgi:L-iditol 2-dehydrogenase
MGSMLTAELVAPHEFRLTQETLPDPGPGEVQVRVDAVGICGSDVHWYAEGGVGDTPSVYPMVLGHEPAGTVLKTGPGVTGWAPGDRAFLEPALYCYQCRFCLSGHHNVCENIRFASNPGVPGFFRERVNLPARNLLAIPPTMSMGLATVVEPLAIALHSLNLGAVQPGESVAVYGAGPIGLVTIAALRLAGAGRIFAVEPVEHRRALARHMGADEVVDTANADQLHEVDCAIDCAAKEDTINQAFRAVRNAGRVLLTGIHSDAMVPFDVSHMRRKEIVLYNVRRSNHESDDALKMLTEHTGLFAPLVTHERPLDKITAAFDIVEQYADGVGKLVITPPASH